MDLERLVYVSHATETFTDEALDEMLAKARDFNRAHGITGLLVYCDPYFAQVIEGPRAEIEALMKSINADPRHRGVFVVDRGPVTERAFEKWEMGFARRPRAELEKIDGFTDFFGKGRSPAEASRDARSAIERLFDMVVRGG